MRHSCLGQNGPQGERGIDREAGTGGESGNDDEIRCKQQGGQSMTVL